MVKDIIISLYLLIFKGIFNLFKVFPLKNKTVFLISFGDNSKYVIEEMKRQNIPIEIVVLFKGASNKYFQGKEHITLIPFGSFNLYYIFLSIYHLATSKYIFVDNYFGELAATNFKKGVQCLQLWHASGAIKKFGLEDESVKFRSSIAKKRFRKVYNNFHKIIVGSEIMAETFSKSFGLPKDRMIRTGIPRTDFFFDEKIRNEIVLKLVRENDQLKYKKKILYAPTFRDNELTNFQIKLDLKEMYKELSDEYVILLRLHPAVKCNVNYEELYPGFVFDYSNGKYDINELLLISNYLITDYSSIPFEFSLLNRPIVFFAYDLETYKKERGLPENYESMVPGPVVTKTSEIISLIKEDKFDLNIIQKYAIKWNKYSRGNSSKNVVQHVFGKQEGNIKTQTGSL